MKSGKKQRIGVIFGGPGLEHSISCLSVLSFEKNLDLELFEPLFVGWDLQGHFHASEKLDDVLNHRNDPRKGQVSDQAPICHLQDLELDIAFPIAHGQCGEDGQLQGHLTVLGIPTVGSDVLGCSVNFHKVICKHLLQAAGLPVVPWKTLKRGDSFPTFDDNWTFPVFVKPASSGSSVAVSKVCAAEDLIEAMEDAWVESPEILIEPAITGREFECAWLLGQASGVGEIVTRNDFYDFEAKYIDQNATDIIVSADIDDTLKQHIRQLTQEACRATYVKHYARVDFLYDTSSGTTYINEINTHPGMTSGSLFPKLWEAEGVSVKEQFTKLIQSIC